MTSLIRLCWCVLLTILTVQTYAGDAKARAYVLGPGDVLQIKVWDNEDLEREVIISPEGYFTFPLIGKVVANGLSVSQLEDEITERLAQGYLVNPQVTVSVKEYKSKKIYVYGEVKKPGSYPVTGDITLIEVITLAGGFTEAVGDKAVVTRPSGEKGKFDRIEVDLRKLMRGDGSCNIMLRDEDVVFFTKSEAYFFVNGQVKAPGGYPYPNNEKITVLKAISIAGGFTNIASTKKMQLIREGEKEPLEVGPGYTIKPGDIVMVRERWF